LRWGLVPRKGRYPRSGKPSGTGGKGDEKVASLLEFLNHLSKHSTLISVTRMVRIGCKLVESQHHKYGHVTQNELNSILDYAG